MPVTFHIADTTLPKLSKTTLKNFIVSQALRETKKKISISYVFCSDEYLLNINKQFLAHDYYTDIITFPLSENEKKIEAEIYISIDRVKDNAAKFKTEFQEELYRVVFHGVLHLAGYKDKTKAEKETMRNKENEWLSKFKTAIKAI